MNSTTNIRVAMSRGLRFKVFSRDSFTCRYCGRKSPDVVLEVDHIAPVSLGGTNRIENLVTSCFECNRGKSASPVFVESEIDARKEELRMLKSRQEQIVMMESVQSDIINSLCDEWHRCTRGTLTPHGRNIILKLVEKYSAKIILESMRLALVNFDNTEENKDENLKQLEEAFDRIKKIAYIENLAITIPYAREMYKAKRSIRTDMSGWRSRRFIQLFQNAVDAGIDVEKLVDYTRGMYWSAWESGVSDAISKANNEGSFR